MRRIVRKLLSLWPRSHCRIERHGSAQVAFDPNYPAHVREYYRYCLDLLARELRRVDAPVNVIFGPMGVNFGDARRVLRVDLQLEHTLVMPGGRDSSGAPLGMTPLPDGDGRYLVRLENLSYLQSLDTIFEYSQPNVTHVRDSGLYPETASRTALVSPLLYEPHFASGARDWPLITLIFDQQQSRRRAFLDRAAHAGLPLRNVTGVFASSALQRVYDRTRVLVNLRQTDHHDTLEELRVLPALLRGVVVVSEDAPLRECVPYHQSIVWCRYGELVETAQHVVENYEAYRAKIFDSPGLREVIGQMQQANTKNVAAAVERMLGEVRPRVER